MKKIRSRTLWTLLGALIAAIGLTATSPSPANATVTPLKVVVFQGNLTAWIQRDTLATVATELAQADILVITNGFTHCYNGPTCSDWQNPRGCEDKFNDHAAWVSVLGYIDTNFTLPEVYGYVAGPADAPDQTSGGVTREAFCGNMVNNYRTALGDPGPFEWPIGSGHYTKYTTNGACPNSGVCQNFIDWVDQWTNPNDSLSQYITGIFIDYVSSEKMSTSIRDNLYSYVHFVGRHIMVNSTSAGAPCDVPGCTSSNGDSGSVYNYTFAADSSYMTANDYVMVEGYYWAGVNGNGGVARDDSAVTTPIASKRTNSFGVKPHLAALVTEPTDGAFTSLSCAWADYTSARAAFMNTAITGDAISYQFSDYGTLGETTATWPNGTGAPLFPIPYCG